MPQMQDRKFGQQMSIALFLVGLLSYFRDWSQTVTFVLFGVAALHLILAYVAPIALSPINKFWKGVGIVVGKIFQPIEVTLIFGLIFTPIALLMRLFGRDALYLRNRKGDSFWIPRKVQEISVDSFRNQF
jgi:membrane-bound metal-dependent hydrolase YbcI (DUF457 family)